MSELWSTRKVMNGGDFDRSSRPGSGRSDGGHENPRMLNQSSMSTSSSSYSISPSSPMENFPVSRPRNLMSPGGHMPHNFNFNSAANLQKPSSLKISYSQPNLHQKGKLNLKFPEKGYENVHQERLEIYKQVQSTGKIKFDNEEFDLSADDLSDCGEIGRGGFGCVNKMHFRKNGRVMAVKRIRSTVDEKEQSQLLMDLQVVMKSNDCPYIVLFYGAIFKEGDCWICMQLMDSSLDKFYKFVYEELSETLPESFIGKVTLATVKALAYLKEKLSIIHRDVKPSNILLDKTGAIKLCDFGISGQLVDSIAKTRDAGCRPYMAPERIDPARAKGYDVRSDVWSLGITLIELATGKFPYPKWNSVFEQLTQVVHGSPPQLTNCAVTNNGNKFSEEFIGFVNLCLKKDESERPKYTKLLEQPFIHKSTYDMFDTAEYVNKILDYMQGNYHRTENILKKMDITDKNGCC
eukprot:TRINITY_DN16708_c0_g2_i1.p1 TRINITY_DN16708_c0_g2~~TRINITY_DN16708_c0_g2_i1.p1  ORF type:complete len:464 (+),score=138.34 TRINITY_DN16708_c0_g2_i1:204-1595(+)